ncbi:ABC-2 type transport system ATP-binding protein [Fontibacillus solani]|uniref:ABC-2 type transport system ATP-binding protein n=1 Tax=Fontibacillus solani TaxID=1572857 RepID=A0A7W3SY63_9BACL|nr:ATP-binding cassette domain-containing protein [Fontibacillus solani]MBA9088304.1 ABC-2 type transport system ATP-binding protein [Fontibacillus solani]
MSVVKLEKVEVSYPQKKGERFYALKKLSIEVEKGEIFCLLGPNGSGKTTCINLINGLSAPTNGEVHVFGLSPHKDVRKVRSKLAVVPQETALYNDLTAKENLLFHAQYYGIDKSQWSAQISRMLELVGLSERQHDRVGTFSGGMQRRLALARALLTLPDLILLDEPTLGVDVQSRNSIWNRIKELASEGRTVFITTNYMEEADQLADRIVIIDKGEISAIGTPQELKSTIMAHTLELYFETKEKALEVLGDSLAQFNVQNTMVDNKAVIKVQDKAVALQILQTFPSGSGGVINFEWKEPTLNDVFLHYTGRQLRN